jgi:hypothetical protein
MIRTARKIASQLVHIQLGGRSPEWLVERNRQIAAVTQENLRRAAHRGAERRLALYDGGRQAGGVLALLRRLHVDKARRRPDTAVGARTPDLRWKVYIAP